MIPALPPLHTDFLVRLLGRIAADKRFDAILGGGSMVLGGFDEHSDLDLVMVAREDAYEAVMATRRDVAAGMGELLAAFTGEHVGEPRLLICLYGPELLHVDFKFVRLGDLTHLVERPAVLWARNEAAVLATLDAAAIAWPNVDSQWFEDRVWVWLHYGAAKIRRGEIFEALCMIPFVEERILGPMQARRNGRDQRGMRRIESGSPQAVERLASLHVAYDKKAAVAAIRTAVDLYLDLRGDAPPPRPTLHMPEALKAFLEPN